MSRWDGKTKGFLAGYQIFLFFIQHTKLSVVYALLRMVTYYYYVFARKPRRAIEGFYREFLQYSSGEARKLARTNFYIFGQIMVDRAAFLLNKTKHFKHIFQNEEYLRDMLAAGKGGILLSAHVGNWETAGNLLEGRITPMIHIVMLDAEVESIKRFMKQRTGGPKFQLIPIKDDLSHVISIRNALLKNEFVAIHADRYLEGAKCIEMDFLASKARFPLGPFLIASKFQAPVTFVFANKNGPYHYHLSASPPIYQQMKPEEIAKLYVQTLEEKVQAYPEQWFNYFEYRVND
ncbi:putative LPLAT superfamily acyltransferase [Dyadobacter jejuensis]|uniref:Putative LPLAT superfamily acyltransferase n=1 Tax=Dyadobacter jejuensis TaxID=1082580 RepID=A0A316AM91_9BACT|nr:lysophospholipid acyltransferase family protein [Dyadobacter jejuensis]PWJ58558.1 putative LPLAT superfamily acyltransferase [Dyadobacter jejuensis]